MELIHDPGVGVCWWILTRASGAGVGGGAGVDDSGGRSPVGAGAGERGPPAPLPQPLLSTPELLFLALRHGYLRLLGIAG